MKSSVIVLNVLLVFNLFKFNYGDTCAESMGIDSFQIQAINGLWHEIRVYDSMRGDRSFISCTKFDFARTGLSTFNFTTSFVLDVNGDRSFQETTLVAEFEDRLVGIFHFQNDDESIHTGSTMDTLYHILATDYTGYMIIWACDLDEETNLVNESILILTRDVELTGAAQITLDMQLAERFPGKVFMAIDQSEEGCQYEGSSSSVFLPSAGYLIFTFLAICHFIFNKL